VNTPNTTRLSLAVPINSSSTIVAATQIVLFLLRVIGRLELDFIQPEQQPSALLQPYKLIGTLLIAANVALPPGNAAEVARLERMIRSQVERQYARHGLPNVDYDLQIV
jgi:hypothetical protein